MQKKYLATGLIFIFTLLNAKGQNFQEDKFIASFDSVYYNPSLTNVSYRVKWFKLSRSNDVLDYQPLSYGIDALNAMYETTENRKYLDDNIELVYNVINASQSLAKIKYHKSHYKDSYRTWLVRSKLEEYKSLYLKETSLSEVYIFQYITKLLYLIKTSPKLYNEKKYKAFFDSTIYFTEKNVWEKWFSRGLKLGMPDSEYLAGRTHIGSHWAFIALMLDKMSVNRTRKKEYKWTYQTYNYLLKGNFRRHPLKPDVLIWNSTYGKLGSSNNLIQDVSHGNLVVSYIVMAYENKVFWNTKDIIELLKLVKDCLWDKSNETFLDNLDGSSELQTSSRGGFQSDGWVKLGRYSRTIQDIYIKYVKKSANAYARDPQLYANIALNEKILSSQHNVYIF